MRPLPAGGLTIAGGIAIDTVEGPSTHRETRLGGSATYAALAAAPSGRVRVASIVGNDLPAGTLNALKARGIDLSDVAVLAGPTARWRCVYDGSHERRRTVASSEGIAAGKAPRLSVRARSSRALLLGANNPSVQLAVYRQVPAGTIVGVDTIDHWINDDYDAVRAVMGAVDIAFIGLAEARQLTGRYGLRAIAAALGLTARHTLVVKGGKRGSWFLYGNDLNYVPAYPVATVVDPTGAGDAYAGSFMACLSQASGPPTRGQLMNAMLWGAAAGSVTVEGYGVESLFRLSGEPIEARVAWLRSAMECNVSRV